MIILDEVYRTENGVKIRKSAKDWKQYGSRLFALLDRIYKD
jgi:hypothetical protein